MSDGVKVHAGFYTSRPFWAGDAVDPEAESRASGRARVSEVMYAKTNNNFSIFVTRDGRIDIHIRSIEERLLNSNAEKIPPIGDVIAIWGDYLQYLNAFYLLLDSSVLASQNFALFSLNEVTMGDVYRVSYKDNQWISIGAASFNTTAYLRKKERDLESWNDLPHPHSFHRPVISLPELDLAAAHFEQVYALPGSERALASFARSLAEYKNGNFELSLMLAWIETEKIVRKVWKDFVAARRTTEVGKPRISKERLEFLDGKDYGMAIITNTLELAGELELSIFAEIEAIRKLRNKVVHGQSLVINNHAATRAMELARKMIDRRWNISFGPNFSLSTVF